MDLRHYEHIVALAEHGNFRKAAEVVHISTPALTKSIQKSEEFFNVRLFDRTPGGALPTPFGETVIRKARTLLQDAADISSDVKSLIKMETGHVGIGSGIYAAEALMGNALVRFMSQYPGIRVKVKITTLDDMIQMLTNKEIDFFVAVYPENLKCSKMVSVTDLASEDMVWYCRPGHPLLKKKKIVLSDLAAFPFICPTLTQPLLEWLLKVFKGSPPVKLDGTLDPHLQCNDFGIIKKTVANGDGIGFFLKSGLSEEFRKGNLLELPIKTGIRLSAVGIVSLSNRTLPLAARRFISILKEEHLHLLKREAHEKPLLF